MVGHVHFIETSIFTRQITGLLEEDEFHLLQLTLATNPDAGELIRGSGGLRKMRWSRKGKGKRGGIRIIYYLIKGDEIYLLFAYPKNKQQDLTAGAIEDLKTTCPGGTPMKHEDFSQLLASIKEAGEIRRGKTQPSRIKTIQSSDVCRIRARLGLSQSEFALLIGVSPRTVQNWEQKRREPEGAAKALLIIADRNPKLVLEALHQ